MSPKTLISVVGPVFNEAKGIAKFHERLMASLRGLGHPFEIIYVDDGSRDGTLEELRRFRAADPEVHILEFSRNFGHQVAITAGMDHASGDAVVIMDTDGQDPPEIIGDLLAKWREGFEVVYAVRTSREGEGVFKKATAALFYRLMRSITNVDIPLDAGDFRLLDRRAVSVMRGLRESHRFVRGLTSWIGFRQTRVEYRRKARLAGSTHYPLLKMIRFSMDGITSFSHQPLRWVTMSGTACFLVSAALGAWALYVRLFTDDAVRGWTSMMAVVLFLGGVQLISIGILGEYLGRIFDEVKRRPLYVLRSDGGLKAPARD